MDIGNGATPVVGAGNLVFTTQVNVVLLVSKEEVYLIDRMLPRNDMLTVIS